MAYIFSGIFSTDDISLDLPEDAENLVFRSVSHNTLTAGVLFPKQAENQIVFPIDETINLVKDISKYGFVNGFWVYYCCWGGSVDSIALAKISNSFINMDSYKYSDELSYNDLHKFFDEFGIDIKKNGHFEPFVRKYWGKYGY